MHQSDVRDAPIAYDHSLTGGVTILSKRLAVLCASTGQLRNTGMVSVDLAAFARLPHIVPGCSVELFTFKESGPPAYSSNELPFIHRDLFCEEQRYLESDAFLFWGDFPHARYYWRYGRDGRKADDPTVLRTNWLTSLSPERLSTATIFGTTVMTNTAEDMVDDKEYAHRFRRLMTGAGSVLMRDAVSAAKVSVFRGSEASLGCDPAFLLRKDDLKLLANYREPLSPSGVGVFFGRTPRKLRMLRFATALARGLGERARWLPWFVQKSHVRWAVRSQGIAFQNRPLGPRELLSELASCRFVVTDTYHVCVNAWRAGVPAICIGSAFGPMHTPVTEKKKEILYEMLDARPFYIHVEQLNRRGALIDRLVTQLEASVVAAQVAEEAALQSRTAELRLTAALAKALGG